MSVTNFRNWVNETKGLVQIINFENPGDNLTLHHSEVRLREMWVPWCDDAASFPRKHIQIRFSGGATFAIWQSKGSVRYSSDGGWNANAPGVPGQSKEGGDREVTLAYDNEVACVSVDEA